MLTQEQLTMMAENVAHIRENMAAAAREAGRDPADILLCAACKTRTVEEVIASAVLPIDLFGENHVQELVEKTDANAYCGKPGHFIGHLQTNKVNKVVGRAALIESVDSEHLLQKVERAAAAANLTQEILIEINIGREESKSGVSAESLWPLLDMAAAQPHIRLRGLMAIPPAAATPDETRAFFAQMRELLAKAADRHYENAKMDILSMGMSGDYEEYGKYMIQRSGHFEYDPNLDEFYDYERYGLQHMDYQSGVFTDRGYIAYVGTVDLEKLMAEDPMDQCQREQGVQMGGMT